MNNDGRCMSGQPLRSYVLGSILFAQTFEKESSTVAELGIIATGGRNISRICLFATRFYYKGGGYFLNGIYSPYVMKQC